jgi:threonylcarbamoyladenosine tRNA methylthiotransferase MtaB
MSVDVLTFGCRLNIAESEIVRRQAQRAGIDELIVVNTCAVTAEAVRQARQAIRRLKREHPTATIAVTGCAAQIEPTSFADMPQVALVAGNQEKLDERFWLAQRHARMRTSDGKPKVAVGDILAARQAPAHGVERLEGHTRAFVEVQNGCDHRCTFCVIPYGRGNSRSVPIAGVIAQIERLVDNGYREIVLTGVDLTSYGTDLPGAPRLGSLVKHILRSIPALARLRLSSIDSVEADRDLLDAFARDARLMPHLHLSLQSGDDLILKRMKRRHTRRQAIEFCAEMRRLRPDVVFGGDLIAGFPTETEHMFSGTLDLVAECGLSRLHVFPFSPRPGTPAARMPQVDRSVVYERAGRLREAGEHALRRHLDGEIGARRRVLAERGGIGRTEQFTPVRLAAHIEPGVILDIAVTGHDGRQLIAA